VKRWKEEDLPLNRIPVITLCNSFTVIQDLTRTKGLISGIQPSVLDCRTTVLYPGGTLEFSLPGHTGTSSPIRKYLIFPVSIRFLSFSTVRIGSVPEKTPHRHNRCPVGDDRSEAAIELSTATRYCSPDWWDERYEYIADTLYLPFIGSFQEIVYILIPNLACNWHHRISHIYHRSTWPDTGSYKE